MEERKTSQQLEREIGFIKKKIVVVERIKCIYNVKRKNFGSGMALPSKGNQQTIEERDHVQISHQQTSSPLCSVPQCSHRRSGTKSDRRVCGLLVHLLSWETGKLHSGEVETDGRV